MDAFLFLIVAVIFTILALGKEEEEEVNTNTEFIVEDVTRVAKLNDAYYDDPEAFMDIAHALGFPKGV